MATLIMVSLLRHLESGGTIALDAAASSSLYFTMDNPTLSLEQRRFYEENGYLVIPRLVRDELLDECSRRFEDLREGRVEKGTMLMDDSPTETETDANGENLYNNTRNIIWDEVLSKYVLLDKLLDYVECFTGPNIKAVHTMLISKPPESAKMTSQHPLQQDLYYFPFRPANLIVASWTAMEKVTVDNGCLVVVPGSHTVNLLKHDYPQWENRVDKKYQGIQGRESQPVNLEMEKGDTVFFHPLLVHGSGLNGTKGLRKAISAHYASTECSYIEVQATVQETEGQTNLPGVNGSKMFWRYDSRLARGRELTF